MEAALGRNTHTHTHTAPDVRVMADDDEDDEAWVDEAWMDEVVESPSSRGANRPAETGIFDLDADDASLANQLSKRLNYHSKALSLAALHAAQERRARGASPLQGLSQIQRYPNHPATVSGFERR